MNSELSSLVEIRKQLNNATDNKININATLTQNSVKLKNRIGVLEEEIENITSQLYAERLENAKLKQEIKETKV